MTRLRRQNCSRSTSSWKKSVWMPTRRPSRRTRTSTKNTRWTSKTNLRLLSRAEWLPTVRMRPFLQKSTRSRKKIIHIQVTSTRLMKSLRFAKRTRNSWIYLPSELVLRNLDHKRKKEEMMALQKEVLPLPLILAWVEVKMKGEVLLSWLSLLLLCKAKSLLVRSLLGLKMLKLSILINTRKTSRTKKTMKEHLR
jgi:hypothetical protein